MVFVEQPGSTKEHYTTSLGKSNDRTKLELGSMVQKASNNIKAIMKQVGEIARAENQLFIRSVQHI